MDSITYIQQQIANVHRHLDTVMKDTTDEQFNWTPPGTINPISAILIHLLIAEDYFIQTVIKGKLPLWVEQDWGLKTNVQKPPEQGGSWDEFKTINLSSAPVLAYEQEIWVATDAYLAGLTVEELNRSVNFAGSELLVAELLMTLVVHSASHAGEIAAVKGMQGVEGLPY